MATTEVLDETTQELSEQQREWQELAASATLPQLGESVARAHDEGNREKRDFLLSQVWKGLEGTDTSTPVHVSDRLTVMSYSPNGSYDRNRKW